MKKILLVLLIGLITLDVDAQLLFNDQVSKTTLTGLSASDEFSSMLKKRKKKRKSSRGKSKRKGGRSSGGGLNVGGGLALGLPMGDFADAVKTGFGLNVEGEYFIMPELSAGISTGYISFKYKSDAGGSGSFNIVPVLLKGNYYFMDDAIRPYVGLGLGLFFDNSKFEYSWPSIFLNPVTNQMDTVNLTTKITDKTTDFALAPTAGVLINMSDNLSFNISAKYNMFSIKDAADEKQNFNFLGFNLGIIYTLGL
ncbi:MAG: OmpW family outer membrane protein [Bacteroidales bacterium]